MKKTVSILLTILLLIGSAEAVLAEPTIPDKDIVSTEAQMMQVSSVKKGFPIQYNGKTYQYENGSAEIIVDGALIKCSMPGLIINETTMVPAYAVFNQSSLQSDYQYDSKEKEVTFRANGNTLVYTLNQTTALLNGELISVPEPVKLIELTELNKSYIMVPGEFTAKSLEYDYSWDNSTATATFATKKLTAETPTYNKTASANEKFKVSSNNDEIMNQLNSMPDNFSYPASTDTSAASKITEIKQLDAYQFQIQFDSAVQGVRINNDTENKLLVTVDQCNTDLLELACTNSIVSTMSASQLVSDTSKAVIALTSKTDHLKYSAELSQDRKTITITCKDNYLNKAELTTSKTKDVLYLENAFGMIPTAKISSNKKTLTLTMPYTDTGIEKIEQEIAGYNVKSIALVPSEKTVTITLKMKATAGYSIDSSGAGTTITITKVTQNRHIAIELPNGVTQKDITTTDDYNNRKFIITLKGNYSSFYKKNAPTFSNTKDNIIKSVKASVEKGKSIITIQTKAIRAFVISADEQTLNLTVKKPKEVYKKVVVIDAGHGGGDTGAIGNGLYEKNVTLAITKKLKDYLNEDPDIYVYYTRLADKASNITKGMPGVPSTGASLRGRYNLANEVSPDLFISIHINSAGSTSARGTESLYATVNKSKNAGGLDSKKLAQIAHKNLIAAVRSSNRGTKVRNGLAVLKHVNAPAVLLESAFISNKSDAAILKKDSRLDDIAQSIFQTIEEAFDNYPVEK